jgi:hypothetical protein
MVCSFLVKTCPHLHIPANGFLSTDKALVGTVVLARCAEGYVFPDMTILRVSQCVDYGTNISWNNAIDNCSGVLFFGIHLYISNYAFYFRIMCSFFFQTNIISAITISGPGWG